MGTNYRGYYQVVVLPNAELIEGAYNVVAEPKVATGYRNNTYNRETSSANLALRADGTVWFWGQYRHYANDGSGRMQVAGEHAEQYPVQVDFASANMAEDEYIIDVQVGQDFFLALSNKGKVYAWGDNYNHQLGDGSATYRSTPVPVTGLPENQQIIAIAAGGRFSVAKCTLGASTAPASWVSEPPAPAPARRSESWGMRAMAIWRT